MNRIFHKNFPGHSCQTFNAPFVCDMKMWYFDLGTIFKCLLHFCRVKFIFWQFTQDFMNHIFQQWWWKLFSCHFLIICFVTLVDFWVFLSSMKCQTSWRFSYLITMSTLVNRLFTFFNLNKGIVVLNIKVSFLCLES